MPDIEIFGFSLFGLFAAAPLLVILLVMLWHIANAEPKESSSDKDPME